MIHAQDLTHSEIVKREPSATMEQQQQPSKPVTKHTLKLPAIALTAS